MNQSRIDITFIRKEQIVDAAVCVIAQQGLQNFSLSEIEKKAHMSRGQLTYYFPNYNAPSFKILPSEEGTTHGVVIKWKTTG